MLCHSHRSLVVFGASWELTSGEASAVVPQGMMDIDVAAVSDAGLFMVLYSDISNNGAMTATMGEVK